MTCLLVVGATTCTDENLVGGVIEEAINKYNLSSIEIVTDTSKGVSNTAAEYARKCGYNLSRFKIDWSDISNCEEENIGEKKNKWGVYRYNKRAAFENNDDMLDHIGEDGVVVLIDFNNECGDIKRKAQALKLNIYNYTPSPAKNHEFKYVF